MKETPPFYQTFVDRFSPMGAVNISMQIIVVTPALLASDQSTSLTKGVTTLRNGSDDDLRAESGNPQ